MKKITSVFTALFIGAQLFQPAFAQQKKAAITPVKHLSIDKSLKEGTDYLSKTIILKVKPAYRNLCTPGYINHPQLNQLLSVFGVQNLAKIYPHHKAPEKQFNSVGQAYVDLSLIYEFNYSNAFSIEKVANKLVDLGILEYAEPHYIPHVGYTPNDPLSDITGQYHHNRIDAYNGWSISQGDTNVVMGITDTGTDPTHNDLMDNFKHNYNDTIDGVDNDLDGYIDNFTGWDVGMNDNDPTWQSNAHGVHVCGIAGATTDNGIGGAGVGFKCRLLPVKIANANGDLIAAYEGITYAADHGADIINCSWGGSGGSRYV